MSSDPETLTPKPTRQKGEEKPHSLWILWLQESRPHRSRGRHTACCRISWGIVCPAQELPFPTVPPPQHSARTGCQPLAKNGKEVSCTFPSLFLTLDSANLWSSAERNRIPALTWHCVNSAFPCLRRQPRWSLLEEQSTCVS